MNTYSVYYRSMGELNYLATFYLVNHALNVAHDILNYVPYAQSTVITRWYDGLKWGKLWICLIG